MNGNCSELLISAQDLARIRAACQRRAAELMAAGARQRSLMAPGPAQNVCEALPVPPATLSEAERFAAAVPDMPPRIRAFFEREGPVPWQQLESAKTGSSAQCLPASVVGVADAPARSYLNLRGR